MTDTVDVLLTDTDCLVCCDVTDTVDVLLTDTDCLVCCDVTDSGCVTDRH